MSIMFIVITVVSVGIGLAVTAVSLFFVFKVLSGLNKQSQQSQQLLQTGVPGQATVMQMGAAGMTVSQGARRSVQMNLVLQVQLAHNPSDYRQGPPAPYQVQTALMVPEIAMPRLQPGSTVPVRVDPQNPQQVAIDFQGMGYML